VSPRSNRNSSDDGQPVAITQMLEDRVQSLEEQFRDLDVELRRRFGDESYSVDRSEQVLGAIQRLRWAIARSPLVNPLAGPSDDDGGPPQDL
jgi:hypothetical protein